MSRPAIALRLLESVLLVLYTRDNNSLGCLCKDILCDSEMCELILRVIHCGNEILTAQTLLCVVPKLIVYTKNSCILQEIWKGLFIKFSSKTKCSISQVLLVLCALADFYLPCTEQNLLVTFSVIELDSFWRMIQCGLSHEDPLIRKQALYLLKRALDGRCQAAAEAKRETDAIFHWNPKYSKELSTLWDSVFLILEVLEEKQVHLVKPVLYVIDKLIEAVDNSLLHPSWYICIFHRVLSHDNNLVVKWGILHLINLHLNFFTRLVEENRFNLISALVNALNNSSLYTKNGEAVSLSEVGKGLASLFASFASLPHEESRSFFTILLSAIGNISWGPVPMFHIIYALSTVPVTCILDKTCINILRNFISDALANQIVYIRGAVQCLLLEAVINLVDVHQLDFGTITDILGAFRRRESLKRGTNAWNRTVHWLKSFMQAEEAWKYVSGSLTMIAKREVPQNDMRSLARMIVLLSDANLLVDHNTHRPTNVLIPLLKPLLDKITDCDMRMYMSEADVNNCIEMLTNLLKESETVNVKDDSTRRNIIELIIIVKQDVFTIIGRRMKSLSSLQAYHSIQLLTNSLQVISKEHTLLSVISKDIESLQNIAVHWIENASVEVSPVSLYFCVKILAWVSDCINVAYLKANSHDAVSRSVIWQNQKAFIENVILNHQLNKTLNKRPVDGKLTRDLQTLWGKVVSEHVQAVWSIFAVHLHTCPQSDLENLTNILEDNILNEAMLSLEIGGRGVLVEVMSAMEVLLPRCLRTENQDVALRLISLCWTGIFEHRKTELFWSAIEKFVQMLFQSLILAEIKMQTHLVEYAQKIFTHGQNVTGLCNVLICQLQKAALSSDLSLLKPFVDTMVEAVLFGPVHRRDQRVDNETCLYIGSLGKKCSVNELVTNDCGLDNDVRARGFQLLLAVASSPEHRGMATAIVDMLLERDNSLSKSKSRYYGDSLHHRTKHRLMQALLLLDTFLTPQCSHMLEWLSNCLLLENHQPSVRYQQEWMLVRLLFHHSDLRTEFWKVFHQASEKRTGSMCSFISVLYHLARVLPGGEDRAVFLDRSMQEILPWCMAQHFNVRLYAQVALQKLWEFAKQHNIVTVVEKYGVVQSSLLTSLESGSSMKNAQKLLEDFYFTSFHPLNHYTLETIFYDLPRLANITYEEWITASYLESCGFSNSPVGIYNSDCSLSDFSVASWVLKTTGTVVEEEEDASSQGVNVNIQKKIIPWKSMVPDHELLLSVSEPLMKRKQKAAKDGLVVVASLIDRPPNLGGLSRTCEVFGVSEYVIGSLRYVEDKQFQSLSVSAERWIHISEVKPHMLAKYLESMKKVGYTVVGAEQTANSTLLHKMKFPKKTLLLLGNEKEGIPADLLPLLDVCVEVPQQGVTRSLNVHVTGAIFVWEYSRQHLV
ncbi:probable methyltransferase TARBP1 isoform X2 [Anabrus simplex]|uniref:probable methyltransferase TARBP1 isoform X2 n=1 Tax=Anabrus simplex TaxID=316456 RepID=UPI0035A336D6